MDEIMKILLEIKNVEEKFRHIQENSALYVSENGGFTKQEHETLEKIISLCGEMNIAANEITKKRLSL